MPPWFAAVLSLAFPALVIAAALRDVATFTIPNRLCLALAAAFLPAALAGGLPVSVFAAHLGVGLAMLVAGMVMFSLRWIGGGDAKLFAAAALWLGPSAAPLFLFGASLAGGGLALLLVTLRRAPVRPLAALGPAWLARLAEPGEGVPYGAAIAAGGLAAFPASPFMALLAHGLPALAG